MSYIGKSPIMCPDTFRRNLPLRNIARYKAEWWTYFLKDVQNRGFIIITNNESSCLMDYRRRFRAHLQVQTKDNDLWLYPKFGCHPFFLTILFTGIGAGFLIFLGIMFLLFDNTIFTTNKFFFWFLLVFVSFILIITCIGVLSMNKGKMTGQLVPVYFTHLMDLYQAARYAEKKVLERHSSPKDSTPERNFFCPECGRSMNPIWNTCPFCGTALYY
ncbi:MAG: hypothetical protein ACTSQI_17055 [Candidatus Helarchaeota archaeon]